MNHPAQDPGCTYWSDGDKDTPVFQRPREFDQLLARYRAREPRRVLEVGTYYGGTLKQWLTQAAPDLVVAVDHFFSHYDPRPRAQGWAVAAGVDLRCLQGDSRDPAIIAAVARFAPFDWIYIDAGHAYHEARADWETYRTMAVPGGVVVFHDIVANPRYHPEIEVPRLWAEITGTHRTEKYVEDANAPWGGLGVVYL